MMKVLLLTCILPTLFMVASSDPSTTSSMAPSATDCSGVRYDMVDCVPFLSYGSQKTKPDASCCSGFETVLKTNADCICESMKNTAQLGIELNITKAMTLHSACGLCDSPISHCDILLSPGTAPVNPPKSSPEPSPKSAPAPKSPTPSSQVPSTSSKTPAPASSNAEGAGGRTTQAPAPSPAHAGTYSLTASFAVLISMVVASFSCI